MRSNCAILTLTIFLASTIAARAEYVCGLNALGYEYLSLRTGPGTFYPAIRRVPPGAFVVVRDRQEGWAQVELPANVKGWVSKKFLCPGQAP
jgi:uncharacterized protein YraI